MAGRLEGKVAVVTGSGQSIGAAAATLLATEGASVVVNSRTAESRDDTTTAADTAREIERQGGQVVAAFADVGRVDGARHVIDTAIDSFGRVDILVNNAGAGGPVKPIEELTEDEWDTTISTNLKSQYACSHFAVPHMRRQGWGRVINIGSNVGLFGLAGMTPYAASKAGSIGLTFALAKDLAGTGVTVNCLLPTSSTVRSERTRTAREAVTGHPVPASPRRTPEAVAPVITYLCSPAADGLTGQVIYSAGGQITLYAWPPNPRTLLKEGRWTLDELDQVFAQYFGAEREPPAIPLPLT